MRELAVHHHAAERDQRVQLLRQRRHGRYVHVGFNMQMLVLISCRVRQSLCSTTCLATTRSSFADASLVSFCLTDVSTCLQGSHFDEYVMDYQTFSTDPIDSSVFDVPSDFECGGFPGLLPRACIFASAISCVVQDLALLVGHLGVCDSGDLQDKMMLI